MKSVSTIGSGLHVVLLCENVFHHHWMAFATWYSLHKLMPNAQVQILCQRLGENRRFFNWSGRVGVPLRYHSPVEDKTTLILERPALIIEPDVMCVREPSEQWMQGLSDLERVVGQDCRVEDFCPFVTYREGCGKFVTASWINISDSPFRRAGEFSKDDLTSNEAKILRLWKQLTPLYLETTRG